MKIAAVLSMLLATSAFGAASLSVTPEASVDATGAVVLSLYLDNPDGANLNGFSMKGAVEAGKVKVISRAPKSGMSDASDPSVVGKYLNAVNDLGFTAAPGTGVNTAQVYLMDLGLQLDPGVTVSTLAPLVITFSGSWNDVDFNEGVIDPVQVRLVPEPASMMLLAAGAAFFARRRRVA